MKKFTNRHRVELIRPPQNNRASQWSDPIFFLLFNFLSPPLVGIHQCLLDLPGLVQRLHLIFPDVPGLGGNISRPCFLLLPATADQSCHL